MGNPVKNLIPNWMLGLQCTCFFILYAVWALPDTIALRYICLVLGALISLYEIYCYRTIFLQKGAIPIWILLMLFGWSAVHLLFFAQNFIAQFNEFSGIWKNAALATLFAVGFGIGLAKYEGSNKNKVLLDLVYLGLISSALIYAAKFILTNFYEPLGFAVSNYLLLYSQEYSSPFYFAKAKYVCFCLPAFTVSLVLLKNKYEIYFFGSRSRLAYLAIILLILFIFYNENIKNGVVYCVLLGCFFILEWLFSHAKKLTHNEFFLLSLLMVFLGTTSFLSIKNNNSWATLASDSKVALATDQYSHWKYHGLKGYPQNDLGIGVSVTNYERISWAKVSLKLIAENPLGYGLLDYSFGRLAKIAWPDSNLEQSHSGWLDLVMGIGIPGFILIMGSTLLILYRLWMRQGPSLVNFSRIVGLWATVSLVLAWVSTEASQTILFEELLFWIAFGAGVSLCQSPLAVCENNASL